MGLSDWWRARKQRDAAISRSLALNDDEELIAFQVPELRGMTQIDGMAHTLHEIRSWRAAATTEQNAELDRRLQGSNSTFAADGFTMPYWGNLWVLRTYQRSLNLDAPSVAPTS